MRTIVALCVVLIALNAHADVSQKDLAKCAANSNQLERLACFDQLAEREGATSTTKPTPISGDKGKWTASTETSPLDDSENVYLLLHSNSPIENKYGQAVSPILAVRCLENKTTVHINFTFFLGTDSSPVTTRLDRRKAQTSKWNISTNNEAVFAPKAVQWAKTLMGHDTLIVRLTPYGESPVVTKFDLRGLKEAIKPLREACHW